MIFPTLANNTFGYINLDTEARQWVAKKGLATEPNPLLDPVTCQQMVTDVHEKYGVDYSFGGWFEDRGFLWKGSYLDETQGYVHLGVDFNVPTGTDVALDFAGTVAVIDSDYPIEGGWGTRVIIKHADLPLYFIYAHLDPNVFCKVGDVLAEGHIFAKVGQAPQNGNWFPHTHVQTVDAAYLESLLAAGTLESLDGYGSPKDVSANARRFRDPLEFIRISSAR